MEQNKKFIIKFVNIFILFFAFGLFIYSQKYTALIGHSYIYPWYGEIRGRVPAYCYEFIFNNFLPNILNENPNDFRSWFGLGSIILSLHYLFISFLFSTSFFVKLKEKWNLLSRKEFGVIFMLSFFLMAIPLHNIKKSDYINFIRIEDLASGAEYFLSYIPFFIFLVFLLFSITKEQSFSIKKPFCIIGVIFSFILGSYNELNNLTAFFCCVNFIFLLFLFNKELLRKNRKQLLFPMIPLLLGMFYYYVINNNFFDVGIGQYNIENEYNLLDGLGHLKGFFNSYFQILIKSKLFYLLSILGLSIFLLFRKDKDTNNYIFFVFALILGYLFTNILMIFTVNLTINSYLFERELFDYIYVNILQFSILILIGIIYFSSKQKEIIFNLVLKITIILLGIFITYFYHINYIKYTVKRDVYYIDKYNLIYSTFGETTILPNSFIDIVEGNAFFRMKEEYKKGEIKEKIQGRYFDSQLYDYTNYFSNVYDKEFIRATYMDDKIAYDELNKRLELLDEKLETIEELKKNKISFRSMYKKYKGRKFSTEELLELQSKKGKSPVLTKAIGFSFFNEKKYDEALEYYNEYLKSNPNDYDAILNIALMYKQNGDYINAEQYLIKINSIDKNNILTLYELLELYTYQIKDKNKAIEICDKMIDLEPDFHLLYINKAIVLSAFGEFVLAEKQIENAKLKSRYGTNNILPDNDVKDLSNKYKIFVPLY